MRHCQKSFAFARLESSLEALSTHFLPAYREAIYLLLWELGSNALKYGMRDLHAPVELRHIMHDLRSLRPLHPNHLHLTALYPRPLHPSTLPPHYLAHCKAHTLHILAKHSTGTAPNALHLCFYYQVRVARFSQCPRKQRKQLFPAPAALSTLCTPTPLKPIHPATPHKPHNLHKPITPATPATPITPATLTPLHSRSTSPHHNGLGHRLIKHYANVFCYNAPVFSAPCAHIRAISLHIKGSYLAFLRSQTP